MFTTNEYITTVKKKDYPWLGVVVEILQRGSIKYYRCIMSDISGEASVKIYTQKEIRHYSAKEFYDDIFAYYPEEKRPDSLSIYSPEFNTWIKKRYMELESNIDKIKSDEDFTRYPDYGLSNNELASLEHMEEFQGCLITLTDVINYEWSTICEYIKTK